MCKWIAGYCSNLAVIIAIWLVSSLNSISILLGERVSVLCACVCPGVPFIV